MKDNYSTRETVFQVMQHMWEIERKPDEDIHSLGIRFQEKAAETSTDFKELSNAAKLYTDRLDKTDPAAQSGVYINSNRGGRPSSNSNENKGHC